MNITLKSTLVLTATAFLLSACATTPKDEAPVQQPVEEVTAPIEVTPDPTPEVVDEGPTIETVPFTGPTPGSVDDFVAVSGGDARVYFGYDQYDLTPKARETLRRQAEWLNTYVRVAAVIEGNADERGTREYNLALGARRAETVKDFLVSQGVAASRLTTVSYGKERPIDARSNEDGWARNRNGNTNLVSGIVG